MYVLNKDGGNKKMNSQIYEMDETGQMTQIDTTQNNNLEIGTKVLWGGNYGWAPEMFFIAERIEHQDFGVSYNLISLKDNRYHRTEAYSMKRADQKVWHGQHMFIQDEKLDARETQRLIQVAREQKQREEELKEVKEQEKEKIIEQGKQLFHQHAPKGTKAVIVAEYQVDESDSMTDYFASRTGKTIVLGFSKHYRNLFPEMRKYAGNLKETEHMVVKPSVNYNGEEKTEENKDWWTASDEHRENYSMGAGTYLKSSRGRGGWVIRKRGIGEDDSYTNRDIYYSLGKRCLMNETRGEIREFK